ncbi:MAG: GAF domain-containing SpoIIE family protein phosphatase [Candidatus Riflebacteria bacterium]
MFKLQIVTLIISSSIIIIELLQHSPYPILTASTFTIALLSVLAVVKSLNLFQGTEKEPEKPQNLSNELLNLANSQLTVEEKMFKLGYLMALTSNESGISEKINYCLNRLYEFFHGYTLIFYRRESGSFIFTGGIRSGRIRAVEVIKESDPLIEEMLERILNLADFRSFLQSGYIDRAFQPGQNDKDPLTMLVPVSFFGRLEGILTVLCHDGTGFSESTKKILQFFADHLALVLDNHSTFSIKKASLNNVNESQLCRRLLTMLFSPTLPGLKGWDFGLNYSHSTTYSGDFHEFLPIPGNRLLILAGHASGKGLDAAIYFTRLKAMIRGLVNQTASPADLLNLLSQNMAGELGEELFTTLLAVIIKAGSREVVLANAGHSGLIINRTRNGFVEIPQIETGVPMGLFNQSADAYKNHSIQLLPGDGLFIYTDGILEQAFSNGKKFSSENIRLIFEKIPELPAAQTLETFFNELYLERQSGVGTPDDQTGIYLKVE